MELKQLEYFIAIVEAGTFSGASVRLSVGQPVLSRQIRALEAELGTRLYTRTGRGIALSEAGKLFEQHARGVLEQAVNARSAIDALRSTPTGRVVMGMPPSVGAVLTASLVERFQAEFPRVALGVIEGFSGHVLEWLTMGRVDVAVLYDAPRSGTVVAEPLVTDQLYLLGPANDPAGAGDGPVEARRLSTLPLILPSRPHGLRLLVDNALATVGATPAVRIEIDAMPSTLSLVERGVAYTVLSYSCVDAQIRAGRIRHWPIVAPTMTRTLLVATSAQRPVTTAARALRQMVVAQVQALVREGRWMPPG